MKRPKITVVVPTRERCDVLEHSLRTITAQTYENLEIIVSDNFSQDDTHGVVRRADDNRIRYLNTGKRLSMSHNWEHAVSHVSEGWVTFVGDDDGLLPNAVSTIAQIIDDTGAKAIRTNYCTYDWPGVAGRPSGQLIVPLSSGLQKRSSTEWLTKALQGKARYTQLPMIYNGGFIHISVLQKIRDRLGRVFASANPDIFSAIAISKMVDDFIFMNLPIAISGTSRFSNGNSSFSLGKDRNPEPCKTILEEDNIPLHTDFPHGKAGGFPLSLQACMYEAHLQSLALDWQAGNINHEQQLPVVLATSGKHRASIEDWASRFADQHGIDLANACREGRKKKIYLETIAGLEKLLRALNSVILDSPPIRNVHEASVAATIIRAQPGRLDTVKFLLSQVYFKNRR